MSGRDVIGVAKTGSGKTIAFLLPMFRHIKDQRPLETMEGPIAMIMTPTRELATQIANEAIKLSHHHKGFEVRLLTGGTNKGAQLRDWMRGRRDIVVATTGRLRDVLSSEPEVVKGLSHTKIVRATSCYCLILKGTLAHP